MERSESLDALELLRLLQLVDSSFPTGAYAFSTGLEGLNACYLVTTADQLESVIVTQVQETLALVDLPACMQAHALATHGDRAGLEELDWLVNAFTPVPAFRDASVRVGRRFLASALPNATSALLADLQSSIKEHRLSGHYPVMFGAIMQVSGIDAHTAALALGAHFVNGQVAAGVRLGMLGQSAAQAIITRVHPEIRDAVARASVLAPEDMGGFTPLVDFAGLLQPFLPSRLFGS